MSNPLLHLNNADGMTPQKSFSKIPEAIVQRSKFNRSHNIKTMLGSGFLIPFMADEIMPGDTYQMQNLAAVIRLVTPIVPIMDNIYADWFFFFIPNRLVWTHWNQFMGEQANPGDTTNYLIPTLDTSTSTGAAVAPNSPYDYMGIPPGIKTVGTTKTISALYGRAFNLVWSKWFRDQNLQNSIVVNTGDGPDAMTAYNTYGVNSESLPRRGKRHDYFTSCLPWPQKINDGTVVSLPLGTTAPVTSTGADIQIMVDGGTIGYMSNASNAGTTGMQLQNASGIVANTHLNWGPNGTSTTGLQVNLASATAATINQVRLAFTMQQLFEKDARGGTYLPEIIKNHFGVISPDARIQWPEYLGGGETPIQISAVPQTSATGLTGGSSPQGNLAAYGAGHESGKISWSKSFVEHGILLGLISIRADLTYQQGIRRQFNRSTRYSFYFPTFANLGEMAVLNQEIYFGGTANDVAAFGYQEAWSELRYYPNEITAGMRSAATPSFAIWHLSQSFPSLPALNAAFIEDTPPIPRITAVAGVHNQFYADIFVNLQCTRPLPVNSVPGLTRL